MCHYATILKNRSRCTYLYISNVPPLVVLTHQFSSSNVALIFPITLMVSKVSQQGGVTVQVRQNPLKENALSYCTYWRALEEYRVVQEETSVFWEAIVQVIVRKNFHTNMCLILVTDQNCFESPDLKLLLKICCGFG